MKVPRQLIAFGVSREAMGLLADTCGSQFETVVPRGSEFRCCIMNDRREDLHPPPAGGVRQLTGTENQKTSFFLLQQKNGEGEPPPPFFAVVDYAQSLLTAEVA